MINETITPEEIAQHYTAAMHSVDLLNAGKPDWISTEDWPSTVSRNVDHLKIMVAKEWWTTEDLTPFNTAIELNK